MSTPTRTHPYDEAYFVGGTKSNYDDYRVVEPAIDAGFIPVVVPIAEVAARMTGSREYLDVGCAMGFYVERFADRGWNAHGIDVSEYAIEQGRRRGVEHLALASGDELPYPDERFDFVTAIDVIEHLEPETAQAMVSELRRVLRPGGICFVATPNFLSNQYWNVYSPEFVDADTTHVNYQSVESLRAQFSQFSRCEIYGHTPFVEQFRAFEASEICVASFLRHRFLQGTARYLAWRLLGRSVEYSSYLHAVATK